MIGLAAGLGGCQASTERGTMSVSPVKLGGGGAEYVAAVSAAAVLRGAPGYRAVARLRVAAARGELLHG
jgi:hypothetical protein